MKNGREDQMLSVALSDKVSLGGACHSILQYYALINIDTHGAIYFLHCEKCIFASIPCFLSFFNYEDQNLPSYSLILYFP